MVTMRRYFTPAAVRATLSALVTAWVSGESGLGWAQGALTDDIGPCSRKGELSLRQTVQVQVVGCCRKACLGRTLCVFEGVEGGGSMTRGAPVARHLCPQFDNKAGFRPSRIHAVLLGLLNVLYVE